jgi:hypothetical protein
MTKRETPKDERMTKLETPKDDGNTNKPYDLDERTALFGEAVIDFAKIYRSQP